MPLAFAHWKHSGHREGRETAPGQRIQLAWVDRPIGDGYQLVDNSDDPPCVPEEPIRQETSTSGIMKFLICKRFPDCRVRQACKRGLDRVSNWIADKDPVVCRNDGTDRLRVDPDPIFEGDIEIDEEIMHIT